MCFILRRWIQRWGVWTFWRKWRPKSSWMSRTGRRRRTWRSSSFHDTRKKLESTISEPRQTTEHFVVDEELEKVEWLYLFPARRSLISTMNEEVAPKPKLRSCTIDDRLGKTRRDASEVFWMMCHNRWRRVGKDLFHKSKIEPTGTDQLPYLVLTLGSHAKVQDHSVQQAMCVRLERFRQCAVGDLRRYDARKRRRSHNIHSWLQCGRQDDITSVTLLDEDLNDRKLCVTLLDEAWFGGALICQLTVVET